ncbi:hypothetical protein MWU63_15590 [Pseudohalocynthiibacter sp. F2068]|nr:hypothetical protein [Pseudohalocynthiibacter sp. F2068]
MKEFKENEASPSTGSIILFFLRFVASFATIIDEKGGLFSLMGPKYGADPLYHRQFGPVEYHRRIEEIRRP